MRNTLELYIAGKKVDLSDENAFAFNYQVTDYTNPTVVKNTYSNTIEIEGTKNNNALFNNIFDINRTQTFSSDYFNASQRVDFQLFNNGELIESGYAKLDNIKRNREHIIYSVTLFGGLGNFFYSLAYDEQGNERTLADLAYINGNPDELDFTINRETVYNAWETLKGQQWDERFKVINFAPAYNGIPESDFDADKVVIYTNNFPTDVRVGRNNNPENESFPLVHPDNTNYTPYRGYVLGTLQEKMTEWDMRELRSWQQRPVLSVKALIDAICNPVNNGGYEVQLDGGFFTNQNPYYKDAYITLPLLSTISSESDNRDWYWNVGLHSIYNTAVITDTLTTLNGVNVSDANNINVNFQVRLKNTSSSQNILYTSTYISSLNKKVQGGVTLQVFGRDKSNNLVAVSDVYWLTSQYSDGSYLKYEDTVYREAKYGNPSIKNVFGYWVKNGNDHIWNNDISFNLKSDVPLKDIFIRIVWNAEKILVMSPGGIPSQTWSDARLKAFTSMSYSSETAYNNGKVGITTSYENITPLPSSISLVGSEKGTHSEGKVTKKTLLSALDGSPLDWLLSYSKLFDLRFIKNRYMKKIYIVSRKSFYADPEYHPFSYEIEDLDGCIDWGQDVDINPINFDSKWYEMMFHQEEDSSFLNKYKASYGQTMGIQRIDTGYNFDAENKDLLDGNKYINAAEGLEKSRYFKHRIENDNDVPTWSYLWTECEYYENGNPESGKQSVYIGMPTGSIVNDYSEAGLDYDMFSKLQLHMEGKSNNGAGVLCFFNGMQQLVDNAGRSVNYNLTDDTADMFALNGGKLCWLYAPQNAAAYSKGITEIPQFGRYIGSNGQIAYAWDFGRTKEIYSPMLRYSGVGNATIYETFWQTYMEDMLDIDTKTVTCTVHFKHGLNDDALHKFYYFENAYWVLNSIEQYNPNSLEGTICTFVKVQDINNYVAEIEFGGTIRIVLDQNTLPVEGGTITGRVLVSDGGGWYFNNSGINLIYEDGRIETLGVEGRINPLTGEGDGSFTITIPANTGVPRTITFRVENDQDEWSGYAIITQAGTTPTPSFDVVPDNIQIDWYTQSALHYATIFNRIDVNSQNNWTATYTEVN